MYRGRNAAIRAALLVAALLLAVAISLSVLTKMRLSEAGHRQQMYASFRDRGKDSMEAARWIANSQELLGYEYDEVVGEVGIPTEIFQKFFGTTGCTDYECDRLLVISYDCHEVVTSIVKLEYGIGVALPDNFEVSIGQHRSDVVTALGVPDVERVRYPIGIFDVVLYNGRVVGVFFE